jgi:hypothetical protein
VETGLKPLLAGHDIREVPISWINRTIDMGKSSFGILKVAPSYFLALARMTAGSWRNLHKTGHNRVSGLTKKSAKRLG